VQIPRFADVAFHVNALDWISERKHGMKKLPRSRSAMQESLITRASDG